MPFSSTRLALSIPMPGHYNVLAMQALSLHPWRVTPPQAQRIQQELASRVSTQNQVGPLRRVAGVDIAVDRSRNMARAAVVVLSYPELALLERRVVEKELTFPYIPGLLSFRETPPLLAAFEGVEERPDLLLADGQGLAHPRRFGIACHLGLLLDLPTIGCAKSRLVGNHGPVPAEVGGYAKLVDEGEVIGAAVRTRAGTSPIYISIGHKVDLPTAIELVLACVRGFRLPEPTRQAHLAAGGSLEDPRVPAQLQDTGHQPRLL
jgi:deoxyribonuclease V